MFVQCPLKKQERSFVNNNTKTYENVRDTVPDSMRFPVATEAFTAIISNNQVLYDRTFDALDPSKAILYGNPRLPNQDPTWEKIEFHKPDEIFGGDKYDVFHGIDPNDAQQGDLGNCYLLSALSALAERPELIKRLFDIEVKNNNRFYSIWLCINGIWQQVIIDDYLPCFRRPNGSLQPAFSRTHRYEIWPMLVEKAYAKVYGCYQKTIGGDPLDTLHELTGAPVKIFKDIHLATYEVADKIWGELRDAEIKDYIMCGTTYRVPGRPAEAPLPGGLYAGHAYSILAAAEIEYEDNGIVLMDRVLQVRNPWAHGEWQGTWNDSSPRWELARRKGFIVEEKDDGVFWIAYDDFRKHFNNVGICKVRCRSFFNSKIINFSDDLYRGVMRFSITKPGRYTFTVDQPDEKFRIDKFNMKSGATVNYMRVRITIGRINSDGSIEYQGHESEYRQSTWIDGEYQIGEYVAVIQLYFLNCPHQCVFSIYGPELTGISAVSYSKEEINKIEHSIWEDYAHLTSIEQIERTRTGNTDHIELHIYPIVNHNADTLYTASIFPKDPRTETIGSSTIPVFTLFARRSRYPVIVQKIDPNYGSSVLDPPALKLTSGSLAPFVIERTPIPRPSTSRLQEYSQKVRESGLSKYVPRIEDQSPYCMPKPFPRLSELPSFKNLNF